MKEEIKIEDLRIGQSVLFDGEKMTIDSLARWTTDDDGEEGDTKENWHVSFEESPLVYYADDINNRMVIIKQ